MHKCTYFSHLPDNGGQRSEEGGEVAKPAISDLRHREEQLLRSLNHLPKHVVQILRLHENPTWLHWFREWGQKFNWCEHMTMKR